MRAGGGRVPVSVLDRSRVRAGRPEGEALRETVALARHVEGLGYHRFWVAEHHGVPGVAGSAPTVLAAAVASATTTLRVGTGGVMLPNHRPLVVAEQFGVLEALFPGRIDVGLGRSVAFTDGIRRALGAGRDAAENFPHDLAELVAYFTGGPRDHPQVHARPAEGLRPPVFVLATGAGAEIAGRAGLALVIGEVRGREALREAVGLYRAAFTPSPLWHRPHLVLSATVMAAPTRQEARRLAAPEAWAMAQARTRGSFPPLDPVESVLRQLGQDAGARETELYERQLAGQVAGSAEEVADRLDADLADLGADELLLTTSTHDPAAVRTSYELLAGAWAGRA
ncbi:MsnO8 family LLM class oxidoreductase [Streptomyces sp. NPDC059740]|uniref:MsnO8 family LLM class oxidoreductase n=1 Tax=Streptomyces sp. NPDC059740 TaxID=3346926 RepID=UPI00365E2771